MKNIILLVSILAVILAACAPARPAVNPTPSLYALTENPGPTAIIPTWTDEPTLTQTLLPTINFTLYPTSTKKYTILEDDTCLSIILANLTTLDDLFQLNSNLNRDCSNLHTIQVLFLPAVANPAATAAHAALSTPTKLVLPTLTLTKIIYPTWTPAPAIPPTSAPAPTSPPAATNAPAPTIASVCCKQCTNSQPCGDTCISKSKTCYSAPGCACP